MKRSKLKRVSPSRAVFLVVAVLFLLAVALVCFLPIWHVIMASISNPTQVNVSKGLILFPLGNMDTTAYKMLLSYQSLWSGYRNTIFYIILSCAITGTLTIVAGFVFSRNRFFYRNTFMLIISFIILMRTSMQEISDSLEEAARLDGANDFIIMFKIVLPLCKATFAVIMLFTIVMKWNDYMSALLYLPTKTELYPLQMELRKILFQSTKEITSASDVSSSTVYARNVEYGAIVISTLPILCVYPFVQKYFVTGMTIGAVKA